MTNENHRCATWRRRLVRALPTTVVLVAAAALWFGGIGRWTWQLINRAAADEGTFVLAAFAAAVGVVLARAILRADWMRTVPDVRSNISPARRTSTLTTTVPGPHIPHNLATRARHEATHAVVGAAAGLQITRITTVAAGTIGGLTSYAPPAVAAREAQDRLFDEMTFAVAPYVDDIRQGRATIGPSHDLRAAIEQAYCIRAIGIVPTQITTEERLTAEGPIGHAETRAAALIAEHIDTITALAERLTQDAPLSGPPSPPPTCATSSTI